MGSRMGPNRSSRCVCKAFVVHTHWTKGKVEVDTVLLEFIGQQKHTKKNSVVLEKAAMTRDKKSKQARGMEHVGAFLWKKAPHTGEEKTRFAVAHAGWMGVYS